MMRLRRKDGLCRALFQAIHKFFERYAAAREVEQRNFIQQPLPARLRLILHSVRLAMSRPPACAQQAFGNFAPMRISSGRPRPAVLFQHPLHMEHARAKCAWLYFFCEVLQRNLRRKRSRTTQLEVCPCQFADLSSILAEEA